MTTLSQFTERAGRCEFLTGADRLWEHVAGVIRDYRDAVEAGL